ncbi:MAG: hypothetical protein UHD09_07060 [Bifidobacterium sp.]|nr:hypothetical protein [Bifidobacterium sp.]
MSRNERLPGVNWYCDQCDADLNDQNGFDDHHPIWVCRECGHLNTISEADIWPGDRPGDQRHA